MPGSDGGGVRRRIGIRQLSGTLAAAVAVLSLGCAGGREMPTEGQSGMTMAVIPRPVSVEIDEGSPITIEKDWAIEVEPASPDLERIGRQLSELLRPALETPLPVRAASGPVEGKVIRLALQPGLSDAREEGYELLIGSGGIQIAARTPAGVFYGMQTLRAMLPASVELRAARPHALAVPSGRIADSPRYAWRGAMLDVARHFFGPDDVKRYIDLMTMYKLNRLHLHLSDDQGWRLEIPGWPNLTRHGATTAVGGGPGGYYTQDDYRGLVEYAQERFVTIVPEIDMPGHTNAALSSYPELTCDGKAPPLFTGIEVGFSALCDNDATWRFVDAIVREIAAMTPGPYFHIGGDEVKTLTPEQYARFMERAQAIVRTHGKQPIGWDEIAHAQLDPATIVQYWRPDASIEPPAGTMLILSPANRVYLDMKYDEQTALGLNWAGMPDVRTAYDWDPARLLGTVQPDAVLGVEAPLWSETLAAMHDIEYMAFPRLAAVAEVAWTPQSARGWDDFRARLGRQAPRWSALGVNAFRTPEIDWAVR